MDTKDVKNLNRDVAMAQSLIAAIDEELSAITSGCRSSSDFGYAIRKTDQIIDRQLANFRQHPLLGPVIVEMRSQYHSLILDQRRPTRSVGTRLLHWIKST